MNFSRKRILIIFSAIFALGICLYLLSGFVISYFLNVDRLQEIVKNQSGLELSLSKPKIRTLPNLSLQMSAEKLLVSLPDSNKNIFNGENLQISIFLPSLFFKNISRVFLNESFGSILFILFKSSFLKKYISFSFFNIFCTFAFLK